MAQAKIKKLQSGGTLVVDGEEYNLREVNDAISVLSPEEQQYMAGLSKALAAGNNWTASSYDNTFTGAGVNDWMSSVFGSKERADRKLGKTSHLSKTFDATVGNKRDAIRRASSRFFLNLRHEYTADASSNPENNELAELLRGSGWFDFDKEGKYVSGPSNAGKMKIYDDAILHFLSPETERKKKKHDSWGSSYDDLLNWIAGKPGASDYFQDLKNKILAGGKDLDDQDLDVLKLLGFDPSTSTNANVPQGVSAFKTKFGLSDDDFNTYFGTDESGNILPKQEFFSLLGLDPTSGNYWLNDAFRQSKGWNNAVLPWIKDLWWINGKLYKGGEQELLDKLNIMGFQNKNTLGDYTGSDSLVRWLWGQETPVSYDRAAYSNFLNDLHGRYFDQRYYLPDDDGFTNIVKYYDFNDDVDQYGLRKAKYAALDEFGNVVNDSLDENVIAALQPYLDEEGNGVGLNLYRRGNSDKKDLDYYNTYVKQIGDNITAYINPTPNPNDTNGFKSGYVILDLPRGGTNAESITRNLNEDESIKIPYEIWQIFGNKDSFWQKLMKNDGLREQFFNTMELLIGSAFTGDYGQNLIQNQSNVLSIEEWQKLGLTPSEAKMVFDYVKKQNPEAAGNWWKSFISGQYKTVIPGIKVQGYNERDEAEERHDRNTIRRMQTNELGGWLPKMQEGGVFGGSNFQRKEKEPVKIKKVEDSTKSKDLLNSNDNWTSSDSLDLASTIVDLGSLAATFAPGVGNIAGAVGGAAADLMRFNSNVSRDGMDAGDWGNLAVGLGMDAVTLLPIVGTGAKAAKLMKTLTKVSKPLSKIFLAIGATEAATALGHLVTTGEFTVEDFRKVAMGAQAAMGHFHIKRAAHAEADLANAINKMIKTEAAATPKVKIGTKEVDILDESVLRSIAGKKPKEAADELKSILKKDRGLVDDDLKDVTDSDLLKAFGFKENKGVLSWFKKTTLPKEKKIGEGDISGRRLSWGEPKHKWNNGEVQTADEFIDAQLANPEIRKRLAAQGWFRNVSSPGSRQDASRINYLAARLAQIAPANDFSTSVGNARVYKGRQAYADWNPEKPIAPVESTPAPERGIIGLLPPAPQSIVEPEPVIPNLPVRVQPSGTPVRISPEPVAPGRSRVIKTQYNAPATGTIVTPFRQVRPNRMLPGRPYPTVPALGKEQRGMVSLNPDNFAEVLQSIVYTPRFRQLVKTNPAAARQLFDKMRFNYIMHGTNGTALTRGQEFDEMAEALKAFNGLHFKKGGKIIKGKGGLSGLDLTIAKPIVRPLPFKPKPTHLNITDLETSSPEELYQQYLKNNTFQLPEFALDTNNVDNPHEGQGVDSEESTTINRAGSGVSINSADLFDAARAMVSANGLQKQYDLLDKANRARLLQQINAPQLVAPKVNTGRERYIAEQAASRLMQDDLPDVTNDSKLRMAARLGQHAQAEGMRYEGLKAETEAITKQHQLDADIHNKQQQLDVDAANKRSQLLADVESKGLQLKADKQRVLSTRIVDPLLQQYGQQLRDEQNKLDALYQEAELAEKQRQANDYMYDELKRNDLYNVWKNSEEYKLDSTDNGYLSWLNANHPELYRMVKNRVYNQFRVPYSKYDIAKNNRRYWWSYLINPKQEE